MPASFKICRHDETSGQLSDSCFCSKNESVCEHPSWTLFAISVHKYCSYIRNWLKEWNINTMDLRLPYTYSSLFADIKWCDVSLFADIKWCDISLFAGIKWCDTSLFADIKWCDTSLLADIRWCDIPLFADIKWCDIPLFADIKWCDNLRQVAPWSGPSAGCRNGVWRSVHLFHSQCHLTAQATGGCWP